MRGWVFLALCAATVCHASVHSSVSSAGANYKCKNASSDWPSCKPLRQRIRNYNFRGLLPISAWWGPVGYYGPDAPAEYTAYVKAGFTNVMVSDRGSQRCGLNASASSDIADSWRFIKKQFRDAEASNMSALIDCYRCLPWGNLSHVGGDYKGGHSGVISRITNHKITQVCTTVRPQLSAFNCWPSTVRPQLFALN